MDRLLPCHLTEHSVKDNRQEALLDTGNLEIGVAQLWRVWSLDLISRSKYFRLEIKHDSIAYSNIFVPYPLLKSITVTRGLRNTTRKYYHEILVSLCPVTELLYEIKTMKIE